MCPGVGLLDHMVALFLGFWGTSILFSIVAALFYISTNSVGGFPFLHTLSSRFFNHGHSDQCEVVPHCSFDLHFSNYSYPSSDHYFGHSRDLMWCYGGKAFHSVQSFCGCISWWIKCTTGKKHLAQFLAHGVESHGCNHDTWRCHTQRYDQYNSAWKIVGTEISTHKSAKHMK